MASKNIDSFLVDHEWLKSEDKDNAPFSENQSHEQLDTLANAFSHDLLEPAKVNASVEEIRTTVASLKRELMLGRSVQHIETNVISNLNPSIRPIVASELKKLASEVGLLGNVYIDPSAFSSCEDGSKLLKNNRTASFAKKMAGCSGCSFNQGGFCRMYKKALVQEVPFNSKTLEHYQNHLAVAGKISPELKIASKQELQRAFLGSDKKASEATSVVFHDESKRFKPASKYSDEGAVSKEARDIANDLSKRLIAGMQPSLFKEYVSSRYVAAFKKHPEVIKKYADLVGSLGNVFVELAPFTNLEDARKFFVKHAPGVKYALADSKKAYTSLDEKMLGKRIISSLSEIPAKEWERNLKKAGKSFDSSELLSNPVLVTKKAFLDEKRIKSASSENFGMVQHFEMMGHDPKADLDSVKTKEEIESSLRMGKPIDSLYKHNERVSSTSISRIVKNYLDAAPVVQASIFSTPCETSFQINRTAKIAAKKDCSGCSYNKGVLCTKLDRSFTVYATRTASSEASEIKASEKKVAVKVDKNLEVELEESGLDLSISKYL